MLVGFVLIYRTDFVFQVMPLVATVKQVAAENGADRALALTSPFDEREVLSNNASYLADTLDVTSDE